MIPSNPAILMLCWNFPPAMGGIEQVADHLQREWRRAKVDVRIIARFGGNAPPDAAVHRPSRPGLLRYLWHAWRTGVRCVRMRRPDVVVCAGIVDAPLAWLLSRCFRLPYVVLAHGSDILRQGGAYQALVRGLFRRASAIAANSSHTRKLLEEAGCAPEKIHIINPGVEVVDESQPGTVSPDDLGKRYSLRSGPILLTVGRVIRRKGIGEFIEHVLPGLVRKFPDVQYVVVGDDATQSLVHHERLLEQIKNRSKALGLERHVCFTGAIDDSELRAWYQAADLFVLPVIPVAGDTEGFGIVILEANLREVPVVSTRIGGIPDAVQDGVTGTLVEPEDWPALQNAVTSLLQDEAARRAMGKAGRERAREQFAWAVIARHYLEMLRHVTAGDAH